MLAFTAFPASASGPAGATAPGNASASIIQPIAVRAIDDLLFGTLAVGPVEGGTITVDPASGATTYTGALASVCAADGCRAAPAVFGVTGEPGRRYRIEVPATAVALPIAGGGPALPLTDLRAAAASQPGPEPVGLLDADGNDRFQLGGTLQVAAGSAPGFYRAEVTVVVTYD